MDRTLVERLHAAGLKALVYTVNDESVAQWLIGNGVDGIISDAVDRFAPASR
jgi:glycerophosphoryl diester phosphodiesterase